MERFGHDWKRIVEVLFADNSRSTVDVKDKWRNIERHGTEAINQSESDKTPIRMPGAYTPRRVRMHWTAEEEAYLREGVERFGEGNWSKILREYQFHEHRTSVDLKDKYRNLTSTQALRPKRKYLLLGTNITFLNRYCSL